MFRVLHTSALFIEVTQFRRSARCFVKEFEESWKKVEYMRDTSTAREKSEDRERLHLIRQRQTMLETVPRESGRGDSFSVADRD